MPAMNAPDGRTLPLRIAHRAVKPLSFWASIYTLVLSIAILSDRAIGQLLDGPIGDSIGLASVTATVLLWVGWWGQKHHVMCHGLLLAASVISAVIATVFAEYGPGNWSAWLSVPVAGLCASAWYLEVSDPPAGDP